MDTHDVFFDPPMPPSSGSYFSKANGFFSFKGGDGAVAPHVRLLLRALFLGDDIDEMQEFRTSISFSF